MQYLVNAKYVKYLNNKLCGAAQSQLTNGILHI